MTDLRRHLPNLLTGMRLFSAPAIGFLILQGYDKAALGIFALAGLSSGRRLGWLSIVAIEDRQRSEAHRWLGGAGLGNGVLHRLLLRG